jgi:hypothetical protein
VSSSRKTKAKNNKLTIPNFYFISGLFFYFSPRHLPKEQTNSNKSVRSEHRFEEKMADKPSRALILYGDGLASLVTASHSNVHSFASLSSCGFLSLRSPPSQGQSSLSSLAFFIDGGYLDGLIQIEVFSSSGVKLGFY